MIQSAHSLGHPEQFAFLALMVRGTRNWRKVARTMQRYWKIRNAAFHFDRTNDRELDSKIYITRALQDTVLPVPVKLEIMRLTGLWEDAIRLGAMTTANIIE